MKTDELKGRALDWAVAKAIGEYSPTAVPEYSTVWGMAGRLIDDERMGVWYCDAVVDANGNVERDKCWYAEDKNGDHVQTGDRATIAILRCYVASKLGDEVVLPEELK